MRVTLMGVLFVSAGMLLTEGRLLRNMEEIDGLESEVKIWLEERFDVMNQDVDGVTKNELDGLESEVKAWLQEKFELIGHDEVVEDGRNGLDDAIRKWFDRKYKLIEEHKASANELESQVKDWLEGKLDLMKNDGVTEEELNGLESEVQEWVKDKFELIGQDEFAEERNGLNKEIKKWFEEKKELIQKTWAGTAKIDETTIPLEDAKDLEFDIDVGEGDENVNVFQTHQGSYFNVVNYDDYCVPVKICNKRGLPIVFEYKKEADSLGFFSAEVPPGECIDFPCTKNYFFFYRAKEVDGPHMWSDCAPDMCFKMRNIQEKARGYYLNLEYSPFGR
eukprot:7470_1